MIYWRLFGKRGFPAGEHSMRNFRKEWRRLRKRVKQILAMYDKLPDGKRKGLKASRRGSKRWWRLPSISGDNEVFVRGIGPPQLAHRGGRSKKRLS
jgi:hypothetical protein